jgi:hypothetical protein
MQIWIHNSVFLPIIKIDFSVQHMKMVHLISWREYQDILLKLKNGEQAQDLPVPEVNFYFEVILSAVRYPCTVPSLTLCL